MNKSQESPKRKPNPILEANFISKWFFWWARETFRKGYREELQADNIYEHIPSLESNNVSFALSKHWEKEVRRKKPNLLRMIFGTYGWNFVPVSILYSILEISVHCSQPLILGGLVSYFVEGQTNVSKHQAYLYAIILVLCSLTLTLCFHPFMFHLFELGTRIRLACSGLVYRKCLRLSVTAENNGMGGFAIAVLSNDLPQFNMTFYFFHDLWKGPIEACLMGYIMYSEIGWPAIIGLASIIVFVPLQAWAAKAASRFRHESAQYGDERVKLMNEIITAIQVIKMYAWEKSFAKLIGAIRKKEIKAIRGSMNIFAVVQCTEMISKLALFLSLVTYVYFGNIMTARKVFIISAYYEVLNDSLLHYWPLAVTNWAETIVCARRVVTFLLQSENRGDNGAQNFGVSHDKKKGNFGGRIHNPKALKKEVILQNVFAGWDRAESNKWGCHIKNITAHFQGQQFVGIVGNVAAGKTTLLNVILGELEIIQGRVEVNGVISYSPQEPWIFESSIRGNILFVEEYDESRYKAVLHACGLERDITLLSHGDSTIVGERGVSLSGGQKARIGLARAIYRQADIYIFDNPLSAVDSHVGKHLLNQCFKQFLADKVRVLVTHHIQHLKDTDYLIFMENGLAAEQGTFEKLKTKMRFRAHLEHEYEEEKTRLQHADSVIDKERDDCCKAHEKLLQTVCDKGQDRKELQMQGSVKLRTYLAYFNALKIPWLIIFVFILFILSRTFQVTMDIFISKWASWEETLPTKHETYSEYTEKRTRLVIVYSILIFSTLALYMLRTFSFFNITLKISLRLHDSLFNGIIRAYMYFFNTNPSGRILNRFSSDIADIDVSLPQAMLESLEFVINSFAVLAVVAIANYWLLIPALAVILLLNYCRGCYTRASRSLKRIEVIKVLQKKPIKLHGSEI